MPSYRFFKPENIKNAEIYWVGSFWKTRTAKWNVNVYLFDGKNVIQTYLPIGAMLFLAVGASVVDGYLRGSEASEDEASLRIKNFENGRLIPFSQLPRSLCSYYGNTYLANEIVYSYVDGRKTYFIPQSEIIRSLLTTNSTFANSMVSPEGLSFLISGYRITGDKVVVELSSEFPRRLVTHGNAIHLMSLFLKGSLRDLWSSVYRHSVLDGKGKQMLDLLPIKGLKFTFKYKQFMNFILIKEIRSVEGLKPPFNSISYSHPNVFEHAGKPEEVKKKFPKGSKDRRDLDHTTSPGLNDNRDIAWHDSIHVRISYKGINAEIEVKKSDEPRKKVVNQNTQETGVKYTLRDYVGDGHGKPIELQNLSVLPDDIDIYGLEKFLAAVAFIEQTGYVKVHMAVVEPLSGDSAFIRIGERSRRCAVLFVESSVIIEFSRPDDYPISTLILSKYDNATIKDDIKRLIGSAIENNGHWDTGFLDGFHSFKYQFAKHSRIDTPEKWGIRLMQKISLCNMI